MPYCTECFEHMLVSNVRKEAGEHVQLKPTNDYFLAAVQAICALAKRPVTLTEEGKTPGCAETAAGATMTFLLGQTTEKPSYFPKSITLEELQTFFKADQPVILDSLTEELIAFEKEYPGTINSINKYGSS
jgi:hypothetical protein